MTAATDCPPCHRCKMPCGSRMDGDWQMPPGRLMCGACGHRWDGTVEELVQAMRADAAYEAQCAAEEAAAKARVEADRDAARLEELHAMRARGEAT